jgi:hypothetical protein
MKASMNSCTPGFAFENREDRLREGKALDPFPTRLRGHPQRPKRIFTRRACGSVSFSVGHSLYRDLPAQWTCRTSHPSSTFADLPVATSSMNLLMSAALRLCARVLPGSGTICRLIRDRHKPSSPSWGDPPFAEKKALYHCGKISVAQLLHRSALRC